MRELEDYKWFPDSLRRHQMEFLSHLCSTFGLYKPVQKEIDTLLEKYPGWTDACSGSGGPAISLARNKPLLLTDLYPSPPANSLPANIHYHTQPLDITHEMPPGQGLITFFNSFHHFSHEQKSRIITSYCEAARPFLVVEILQPGFRSLLSVIFATTIGHWLLVPFMQPFSFRRIFFTYLLPVHTFTVLYDGVVSVLKAGSKNYYRKLASSISTPFYQIEFKIIPGRMGPLYILKGAPAQNQS